MELEKIEVTNIKTDNRALVFYYCPTFKNTTVFVNAFIQRILGEDYQKLEYIKIRPWQQEEQLIAGNMDLKSKDFNLPNVDKGEIRIKGYSSKLYANIQVVISTETGTILVSSSDLYVMTEYLKRGDHKKKLLHDFNVYMDANEIAAHVALQTDIKKSDY